jgi:calcium-dependent protein kinase
VFTASRGSALGLLDLVRWGHKPAVDSYLRSEGSVGDVYDVGAQLGSGRFGVVYEATRKNDRRDGAKRLLRRGQKVAIKSIAKKRIYDSTTLSQEVDILRRLDGKLTMSLIECFEDKHTLHLVSDLYTGGELFDRIVDLGDDTFSEADASRIMWQVVSGIKYLHDLGITHRDIKPENIMFRDKDSDDLSDIVLVDFGMSTEFVAGKTMSAQVGSPSYVAPEVLEGRYTEKADLWSLGVIMYILLCGEPPFHGDSPSQIMRQVRDGTFDMNQVAWRYISPSGRDLVVSMMTKDMDERITLDEIIKHPWWEDAALHLQPLPPSVVASLRTLEVHSQVKRRAIEIIAKGMQDSSEFDPLRTVFTRFDHDGDGIVSVSDLGRALKQLGVVMNADDIDVITSEIDQDGDGCVSFDEFLAAAAAQEAFMVEERLRKAFAYFDLDRSGGIDEGEMFEIVGNMDDAREVMRRYDVDDDGVIDFAGEVCCVCSQRPLRFFVCVCCLRWVGEGGGGGHLCRRRGGVFFATAPRSVTQEALCMCVFCSSASFFLLGAVHFDVAGAWAFCELPVFLCSPECSPSVTLPDPHPFSFLCISPYQPHTTHRVL